MAPRTTRTKPDEPDPLKSKAEKAKVEKVKAVPKVKAEKVTKAKVERKSVKDDRAGKEEKSKDAKGDKVKAVTGDDAAVVILEYLKAQNRPYSATELSANLHGKVTKTVADKLLKEMEQNQQIMAKATNGDKKGSQWVFWALQNPADAASPEELAMMDETITSLKASIPGVKSSLKNATTKLNTLRSAPATSELGLMVRNLRAENERKIVKLTGIKTGTVKLISREELEAVEKEWRYWSAKKRTRQNAFDALEAQLVEAMSKEELWEKAGIESDE